MASIGKASIEANKDDSVDDIIQKGKYIIVKYNESAYEDLTLEEVKLTYSYLEQVQN